MKQKHHPQEPSADDFIDFRLCKEGAFDHHVYKWLRAQASFRRAEKSACSSQYFQSLKPGSRLKLSRKTAVVIDDPRLLQQELLEFAQWVSYCFSHYIRECQSKAWDGSASQQRERAARAYCLALVWSRRGFGPYAVEDQKKLEQLLTAANDYLLGKHLSKGFRMKGGDARPIGMLIRELATYLDSFEIRPPLLTSIIMDLVSIVATDSLNERTVQRHLKAISQHLAMPTDR